MPGKKKIVINFCPTGMIPVKAMTAHVPISPSEIIDQTQAAFEIGITIAHLHARNSDETPSWKPEIYQQIFEGVRKHCPGLVICGSSSGRTFPEFEKRSAVIELRPDMCSLTLSSLNFADAPSLNAPKMIQALAQKMHSFGVHPELECFDFGMINYGHYLIRKGLVRGPFYWNLIFGNIAGFQASADQMQLAAKQIPAPQYFSFGGLGEYQRAAHDEAMTIGCGVRIGLEDNIWWDSGRTRKATNLDFVRRIHDLLNKHGHELYTSCEFGDSGFYNGYADLSAGL